MSIAASSTFDQQQPVRRGGRLAAEAALASIDPSTYVHNRNFLDGAATRLSPYLRHGVLTLAEVRDHALSIVGEPSSAAKFINELAWRDYWQRIYAVIGDGVWKDREEYKTGFAPGDYHSPLPDTIVAATTGLHCMDSFSRQLQNTGYLHNHARMWMASYVVHWLRIRWQAGARWFLQHLLDGDPASNNLSWQWVASTFGAKPYYFNRENLERYTAGLYCRDCALRDDCPLDDSYEDLEVALFPHGIQTSVKPSHPLIQIEPKSGVLAPSLSRPLIWVHTDSLNPKSETFEIHPAATACFIWDQAWLHDEDISSKRVVFIEECLAEFPSSLAIRRGDIAAELLAAAANAGADHIVAQRTPDPRLLAAAEQVERHMPLQWIDPPPFTDDGDYDLRRFSRYWQKAKFSALQTQASPHPKR